MAQAAMSSTSGYAPEYMQYHAGHFACLVVFSAFATTTVILRFWARKIQNQAIALHDYLILLGLIFALAETGVSIYGCCFPVLRRKGDVPEELGLQLMFLAPVLWVTAVTTIRAAIILLYIQIFPIFSARSFHIACYATLAVNVLFGASAVIADCLICQPITYRWAPKSVSGSCGDQTMLDMYIAIFNLLQDVAVVALPMPVLWRLQMAKSRKVAMSCMFGMGVLICAITIYRVQVTSTIGDPTTLHAQETYCRIALLTALEALLGIISASLLMLKPLFCKLRDVLSERGTNTFKSSTSSKTPIVSHKNQMQNSLSSKHGSFGTTDSFCYAREVDGKCERQSPAGLESDRAMEAGSGEKPRYLDPDPESLISDI